MKYKALKKITCKSGAGRPRRQKLAPIRGAGSQGSSLNLFALRVFADKLLSCPLRISEPALPAVSLSVLSLPNRPAMKFVEVSRAAGSSAVNLPPSA